MIRLGQIRLCYVTMNVYTVIRSPCQCYIHRFIMLPNDDDNSDDDNDDDDEVMEEEVK